jgi:nitroreductase
LFKFRKWLNFTHKTNFIMIKIATPDYPVSDIVKNRWSARAFSNSPISDVNLKTMLEAASWAASSMNDQPWVYVYAHKENTLDFQKFVNCLSPGNQPWASNAAVLVLSLARKNFLIDGNPNRHALHDVGMANATLLLEAIQLNVYGHMMGGFDMAKTITDFQIDTQVYEVVAFIALGYLGDPQDLVEPYRTRELTPRQRRKLVDFAFENSL